MLFPGEVKPRDRAGNADGEVGVVVLLVAVLALLVEPHLRMGLRRRHLAEIVGGGLTAPGPEDEEPPSSDVSRRRMGDGESESGGDSGVDGVSARFHDVHSHLRSDVALGNHHAVLRPRGLIRGEGGGCDEEDQKGSDRSAM